MNPAKPIELTIGHSPDADDAFMWWPLGGYDKPGYETPSIDTEGFKFTPVALDIEELNSRAAATGDLDITALSMHCLAHVTHRYALTSCGWSMGDGYGPKVVSREPHDIDWLREPGRVIAIPGQRTSAYLATRLMLGDPFQYRVMRFDKIMQAVANGNTAKTQGGVGDSGGADAGVIIHDGQISYRDAGLHLIADLGQWWKEQTDLPLPLGANAVRKDLDARYGGGTAGRVTRVLKRSIEHAMSHRERGLDFAMDYAPDADRKTVDRFVAMYVNALTLDGGEQGERAVRRFLDAGANAGFCPSPESLEVIRPSNG